MEISPVRIYFPPEDQRDIQEKIGGILRSGQLTLGKYGKELEEEFARKVGVRFAVAVNSGTSALEIILRCLGVAGRSVVVPTNTFFASAASVIHAGGRVILADCGENLCLSPREVERRLEPDTVAVMFVHIGGLVPPEVYDVQEVCRRHNIMFIEDAAHAHGSTLDGKQAGSFGWGAAFSFYPTKVMTSAEGGMITTNNESLYQRAQVFRDQGKAGFLGNVHTEIGYNWRLSEVHAVLGLSQFRRLPEFVAARRAIAEIYDRGIQQIKGVTPLAIPSQARSNYYKYVAFIPKGVERQALKKRLREEHRVSLSGEVYELPCHLQPILKDQYGFREGDFPVAEDLCRRHICLPLYPTMVREEAEYVLAALKESLK